MKTKIICLILAFVFLSGCRGNTSSTSIYTVLQNDEIVSTATVSQTDEIISSSVTSQTGETYSVNSISQTSKITSSASSVASNTSKISKTSSIATVSKQPKPIPEPDFAYGVWLSYYEIDSLLKNGDFKENFSVVLQNLKLLRATDLYVHVHSHCDSIFKSKYYPLRESAKNCNFDIFKYMVEQCHENGIRVHAWINPYRVSTASSDIKPLPEGSPAYKWLTDKNEENDKNVLTYNNGLYLNPAESQVRKLVTDGIKEILKNYNVDGIHFDDYFYPTTSPDFDKVSYEIYANSAEFPLNLADWRRANTDALVSDCNIAIKKLNKNAVFSISPAADIERNYNSYFADIGGWIGKGYIDVVLPQLYFGFNHTNVNFCFENLLSKWIELSKINPNVDLQIGLATYKIDTESETDGDEWKKNTGIISKQITICQNNKNVDGVVFFSYTSLFSSNEKNTIERTKILNVIKK